VIISVIGLMFGDEGKGHTVAALTKKYAATANVRFSGGSQAAHRVVSKGVSHIFAQFGSGTAVSKTVKTYLTSQMVVDPLNLLKEAEVHEQNGLGYLLQKLAIDPNCPIITPFHKHLNQTREMCREHRISTTGLGVGEVFEDVRNGKLLLFAKDLLTNSVLKEKIFAINKEKTEEMTQLLNGKKETDFHLSNPDAVFGLYQSCGEVLKRNICEDFDERLLEEFQHNVILEGSQGTLLDRDFGTKPFITKANVSLLEADRLLSPYSCIGDRLNIGVVRSYLTRHGIGPMYSEDEELTKLLPDSHNKDNEWQTQFRCGWLDLDLLEYSLYCNRHIDNLVITNMDRLPDIAYLLYRGDKHPINKSQLIEEIRKVFAISIRGISSSENVEDFVLYDYKGIK